MSANNKDIGTSLAQTGSQAVVSFQQVELFNRMASGAVGYAISLSQHDNNIANPLFMEGQAFFDVGNFDQAIKKFMIAAELGHLVAQLRLGGIFLEDIGGNLDYDAAHLWFIRAADQGDARAQLKLGWMHEAGLGVDADNRRAVYWYRVSAELGNPEAQFNIGVKYDNGEGVDHNPEEAVRWFMVAAEHGLADARYFLGQALESGDGVESNLQEAIDWYFVASEQGHASGRRRFWSLCISGAFRPETYEETIFAELIGVHLGNSIPFFRDALRLRKGWEVEIYSKICRASRGDATSQFELGNQYHIGDKVLMDFDAAIYWYKLASEQNYPFAWNNLGIIYNIPQEIYFDEVEAASCFRKASELGYFNQMTALGNIYYTGKSVSLNYTLAREWYLKAMNHGDAGGFFGLGLIYGQGLGVEKDLDLARTYFVSAVDRRPSLAGRLYEFYSKGIIFSEDQGEAKKWKPLADKNVAGEAKEEISVGYISDNMAPRGRYARLREKRNKERPIKGIFD